MIPTLAILEAARATIEGLNAFDRVTIHPQADFATAFESLRDSSRKLCFLAPGSDSFENFVVETFNIFERSEMRSEVHIIASTQSPSYATTGDPDALTLKDNLIAALLAVNLGIPGLLVIPKTCEPLRLEWDDAPARFAWQLTLECRQTL